MLVRVEECLYADWPDCKGATFLQCFMILTLRQKPNIIITQMNNFFTTQEVHKNQKEMLTLTTLKHIFIQIVCIKYK